MLCWPVEPMRPALVAELPDLERIRAVAEPKWDGFRALARRTADGAELYSRHGRALSRFFPDVCQILTKHLPPDVVLDGELVIWDTDHGHTSFTDLQARLHAGRHIDHQAATRPAHLVCFDLLQDIDGRPLLRQPLAERRARLERLLASAPPQLAVCPQTRDQPTARRWFGEWPATGIEGLVVKGQASRYVPGTAGTWKKIKARDTVEMIIGGCTGPADRPASLLLGRYDRYGRLHYLTHTQPLTATQQHELAGLLRPMPFQGTNLGHPWPLPLPASWSRNYAARQPLPYLQVEPILVAEVELDIVTDPAGRPRHPARHVRTRSELQPGDVPLWPANPHA